MADQTTAVSADQAAASDGSSHGPAVRLQLDAPWANLCIALQRSIDSVGHAMRAIDQYRPDRDHTLPANVIAALGVSTQSHVPGAPIAVQIAPSIPMEHRNTFATTWILQKGFVDVIAGLNTFVLQHQRLFAALEVFKRERFTVDEVHAAAALDSKDAMKFDRKTVPDKIVEVRKLAGLEHNVEYMDLEHRVLSINRARNCLEHRNGYVGLKDCADGTNDMPLEWVGPDMTDGKDGKTVKPGEFIESMHVNLRTKRRKTFARDALVVLSPQEFVEVCWTVKQYAEEVLAGAVRTMRSDPKLARYLPPIT
jgi:hypothetical protein